MISNSAGSAKRLDFTKMQQQQQQQKRKKIQETRSTRIIGGQMKLLSSHQLIALIVCIISMLFLVSVLIVECHIKRTQYHEQGLHGPKSYKYGYTSGDHKNPQERHEVSDKHGHVKGWYSFVDAAGKHQVVHYEAHPKYGFKVFNHKEKAYNNGKRHYNS